MQSEIVKGHMQNEVLEGYRLSPQQERVWVVQQQGRQTWSGAEATGLGSRAVCAIWLRGRVEVPLLERSIEWLVRRHEILRTRYQVLPGMRLPLQLVCEPMRLQLEAVDLSECAPETRQQRMRQLVVQEAGGAAVGVALAVRLIRLEEEEQQLLMSLPQLSTDERSWENLLRELGGTYARLAAGAEPLAEAEAVPYVVYAEWQHELLAAAASEAGRRYWRSQDYGEWQGAPPRRRRQKDQGRVSGCFQPERLIQAVNRETSVKLSELAGRLESEEWLLLAGWESLLWRLGAGRPFAVGVDFAGRTDEELAGALGLFARTLPLGCRVRGGQRWEELVGEVRAAVQEAEQWQECFSWAAVEATGDEPRLGVCFSYEEEGGEIAAAGLRLSVAQVAGERESYALKLKCVRRAEQLRLEWHYDGRRYTETQVQRLGAQFETLLKSALDNPASPVAELEVISAAERRQLLEEWNDTQAEYGWVDCLHQLFEQQVERSPEAVAVVSATEQVSYRELNERANRLAAQLRGLGVEEEELVGVLMERSLDLVVAMLGVLKAGGGYVPLEVSYPAERVRYMLADAGVKVLLTHAAVGAPRAAVLSGIDGGLRVVCVDEERAEIERQSAANQEGGRVSAQQLAYVIYTSGSTGRPKGVMIPHGAIVNHMQWMGEQFPLAGEDAVLQKTPISFDASVWEFYAPLLSGARLVLAEVGGHQEASYLERAVREQGVTVLQVVPTMLRLLVEGAGLGGCSSLKRLYSGGEVLGVELAERVREQAPWARLYNLYGPTEASIDATWWEYEAGEGGVQQVKEGESVAIGRPIGNMRAYVLDPEMRVVAVGVEGELYLGGAGVGRGYLNRAELTAERFVPDPFVKAGPGGERLYRTGDVVRRAEQGELEYVGRVDEQVKLRGYRVELGEIEAAIEEVAGVRQAVVEVSREEQGERLVAYLLLEQAGEENELAVTAVVRTRLKERLPQYMLPAAYVVLKELPLMPNGKLDRRALPAPSKPELAENYAGPRNAVEETLAGIWAAVLRIERVGIHDNFFDLGGDSILSLQVISRCHQEGISITPKQLFDHPTIGQLSTIVDTAPVMHFAQGVVEGQLPLTPIQHLFFEQELPNAEHYNQSTLLEVRKELDAGLMAQAVMHLISHHDALRLRFVREAQGVRQFNAATETNEIFSLLDFSFVELSEQGHAIEEEADKLQRSLNLTEGPLMRVALFNLGVGLPGRLLIVIHHLVVDGVSWRVLMEDLHTAYEQLSRGEPVRLPSKTTSFKEWAESLNEYAKSDALVEERAYWLAEPRRHVKRLPVDHSNGVNTEASGRTVSVNLSEDETRALLQEVPAAYHTQINDVLMAGLTQTFLKWTGESHLLLDMEGHGREELIENVDLSRTVGWFTTVFPVLLELEKASGPGQALKSIKEQLRQIPNRGIGYGLLRYLSADGELRETLQMFPSPEVCFNYLGQWDNTVAEESPFVTAQESGGPTRSELGRRTYLLDISGSVYKGQLQMNWTYSENIHQRTTIETLAHNFMDALRAIIAYCQAPEAGGFTPSDFPAANLNQTELDNFISSLG